MAPPLPEASQPSNTTQSGGPRRCSAELAAEQQPQVEHAQARALEALPGLGLAELGGQVDLRQAAHADEAWHDRRTGRREVQDPVQDGAGTRTRRRAAGDPHEGRSCASAEPKGSRPAPGLVEHGGGGHGDGGAVRPGAQVEVVRRRRDRCPLRGPAEVEREVERRLGLGQPPVGSAGGRRGGAVDDDPRHGDPPRQAQLGRAAPRRTPRPASRRTSRPRAPSDGAGAGRAGRRPSAGRSTAQEAGRAAPGQCGPAVRPEARIMRFWHTR